MQTKHLCVLIHTRIKGMEPLNLFKPSSDYITDKSKALLLL